MIEYLVQHWVDFLLQLVRMNMEIRVAGKHRGQLRFGLVIEDVARNAMGLGIGQFVAHAQRGARAFTDEHVALAQPCRVLVIDARIALTSLLCQTQVALAHMLGEHNVGALDITDDAVIQVGIHATATDRPRKINLLCHSHVM